MAAKSAGARIDAIARECLATRVRRLSRIVTGVYDDALRPLGLTVSQLTLLVAAARMGRALPRDVCGLFDLDASTLSRTLERMRARGWVEAVPGDDARSQPFRLTSAGRRVLDRAIPAWEGAQRKARALLRKEGTSLARKRSP